MHKFMFYKEDIARGESLKFFEIRYLGDFMPGRKKPKCVSCNKGVDVFGADASYIKVVREGSGVFYHEKCFIKKVKEKS